MTWFSYAVAKYLDMDDAYTVSALNNNSSTSSITVGKGTDTFDLGLHYAGKFYLDFDLTNNTIVNDRCEGKEEIDVYLNFGDSKINPIYVDMVEHSEKLYKVSVNCDQKKLVLTGV